MQESFEVRWKASAQKDLRQLESKAVRRIVAAVDSLETCAVPTGASKIVGSECSYRIRVGDYRVLYSVLTQEVVIEVIRVRHRKDVYRGI